MNLFNDRELALRFSFNQVASRERFLYLLVYMLTLSLATSSLLLSFIDYKQYNEWDALSDASVLAATLIGTICCYRTNRAGDDREFIERYVSLGVPVCVRMILYALVAYAAYTAYLSIFTGEELPEQNTPFDAAVIAAAMAYYYVRLNASIRIAAS